MKEYLHRIVLLIKRILLLLVVFQVVRLFFFIWNHNFFTDTGFSEILSIFFFGIRFDYTSIVYYNGLFLLLSIIPISIVDRKPWQLVLKILFVSLNSIIFMADMADAVYFEFSNKRTTFDFISDSGQFEDFILLTPRYLIDFWIVPVITGLIVFSLIYFYPKTKRKRVQAQHSLNVKPLLVASKWTVFIILATMIYFLARGFNLKPIRIITASEYTDARHIPLILNTGFSIITTSASEELPDFSFFNPDEIEKYFSVTKDYSKAGDFRKLNVVVIIMESFGKEYIGSFNENEGYTPFLETLLSKGINCTNAFSNGRRSIEALPAIISGIPALTLTPFITSQFATNEISGIPALLKKKGYHSSFFHGGRTGTMGFDYFAKLSGIDHYYGKEDYPWDDGSDGKWGIYDEEYFRFFKQKLSSFPEPFFSCFFSLSSHHPYEVPEKYNDSFRKGSLEIHKTVQYTDYALGKFFEWAQEEDWYSNTLFIITADHTSQTEVKKYHTLSGAYQIPLLFYHPSEDFVSQKVDAFCSHIDIFPTVMDYLNFPDKFNSFGNSILTNPNQNMVVTYTHTKYQYLTDWKALYFDGIEFTAFNDLRDDLLQKINLIDKPNRCTDFDRNRLKAMLQTFSSRMKQNQLIYRQNSENK